MSTPPPAACSCLSWPGAPRTPTGHCLGCAEEAAAWGDGTRVGLPLPADEVAAAAYLADHPCDGTCWVCALATSVCSECGMRVTDMDVATRRYHGTEGDTVIRGCESYVLPVLRAAGVAAGLPAAAHDVARGVGR